MANSINTNIAAYYAQANIGIAAAMTNKSVARLSSGNRIVTAADDVAALSIGTSLRTGVATLKTALTNASQGSTLLQIADGALSQVAEILQRQKSIALQAGSGSLSATDRGFLDQEFQALTEEIDRITSGTNFNNVNLIDGSLSGSNPLRSADSITTAATVSGLTADGVLTAALAFADAGASTEDITFYGDLSGGVVNVTYVSTNHFLITYAINGSTYQGEIVDSTDLAGASTIVLSNGLGTLTFTATADDISGTITDNAAGAAILKGDLETLLSGASAFQSRTLRTTDATSGGETLEGTAIAAADTNGTLLEGLLGSGVTIKSQFWNGQEAPTISNFRAVGTFGVGTRLEVTIDGRTYRSAANLIATGIDGGAVDGFGDGNGVIDFFLDGDETTNANEWFKLTLTGVEGDIDIDTQEGMNGFLGALNGVFGKTGGGLEFQVGAASTDVLQVLIASATTATLFEGETLDVLTQDNASDASTAITTALAAVSAIRANVGASQSRFNFASANIQTALQNQDAARGELLDTDIAAESTSYATSQVKLQAGISVLAQANQQLQSLLKLIG